VSPFSSDEIHEGKKCHLNHWRRTPEAEATRQALIESHINPKKSKAKFGISLHDSIEEEQKEMPSTH